MQCKEYVVKEGDTLYSLARENGTTVEEILQLNGDIEPTRLAIGTLLCIPRGGALMQDPDAQMPSVPVDDASGDYQTIYIVKEGDTLLSIAERFNISPEQLLSVNPNLNPGYIIIGTELNIPKADTALPGSVKYVVKEGEELMDILKRYGIGYGRLKLFNPKADLINLSKGMIIFIPEVYGGSVNKCALGSYAYTIKQGDTAESVAKSFNLPVSAIENNNFTAGNVICLPLNNFDDKM